MCRLTALITRGEPMLLADILTRPRRSIIQQSFNCQERLPTSDIRNAYQKASLNGDGFGVGWYAGGCGGEGSGDCGGGPWLPGLDASSSQSPTHHQSEDGAPQSGLDEGLEYSHSATSTGCNCVGAESEACVFTSLKPAWADRNLYNLAEKISSRLFFAHVRAASSTLAAPSCCGGCEGEDERRLPWWSTASGGVSTELCCHPFQCGRFLFMHNGSVGGFAQIRRSLLQLLPDSIFTYAITNSCIDSVCLFALFLALLPGGPFAPASPLQIKTAIEGTIQCICFFLAREKILEPTVVNVVVSDGCCVVATRFVTDYREVESSNCRLNANANTSAETGEAGRDKDAECRETEGFVFRGRVPPLALEGPPVSQPASLYFATGTAWRSVPGDRSEYRMVHRDKRSDVCIITSEPLTSSPEEWLPVPRNTMLLVTPAIDLLLYPIAGVPCIPRKLLQQRRSQRPETMGLLPPLSRQPASPPSPRVTLSLVRKLYGEVASTMAQNFEAKFHSELRRLASAEPGVFSSERLGTVSFAALHALREVLLEARGSSLKRLEDLSEKAVAEDPVEYRSASRKVEGPSGDGDKTGQCASSEDGWAELEKKLNEFSAQRASSEGPEERGGVLTASTFLEAVALGGDREACLECRDSASTPIQKTKSRAHPKAEPENAPRGYEVQAGEGAILCVEALTICMQDGGGADTDAQGSISNASSNAVSASRKSFVFVGTERGDVLIYEGSRASASPVVFRAHEGSVLTLAVYVEPQAHSFARRFEASSPALASLQPPSPCMRCGSGLPEVFLVTGSCDTSVAVWNITPLLLGGPRPEVRRCGLLACPSRSSLKTRHSRAPSLGSLPLRICSDDLLALRLRLSPHQGDVLSLLVLNGDAEAEGGADSFEKKSQTMNGDQPRLRGCSVDSSSRTCVLYSCQECRDTVRFALKLSEAPLNASASAPVIPSSSSSSDESPASIEPSFRKPSLLNSAGGEGSKDEGTPASETDGGLGAWREGPLLLMGFQSAKIGCVPVKSLIACYRHSQLVLSVLTSAVELESRPTCGTRDFDLKALVSGQVRFSPSPTLEETSFAEVASAPCSAAESPSSPLSHGFGFESSSSALIDAGKKAAPLSAGFVFEKQMAKDPTEAEEKACLSALLSECARFLRNIELQGHLAGASLSTRFSQGAWRCLYAPSGTVYSYETPQEIELPLPHGASATPSPGFFRVMASASKIRIYANPSPETGTPNVELRFLPLTQEAPLCSATSNASSPLRDFFSLSLAHRSPLQGEGGDGLNNNNNNNNNNNGSSPTSRIYRSPIALLHATKTRHSPSSSSTKAPDGAFLASCLGGAWMDKIGHNGFVECLVACGGSWLCSGGGDGRVLLWEGAFRLAAEMKGHSGGVLCLAFCRKKCAAGGGGVASEASTSRRSRSSSHGTSVLGRALSSSPSSPSSESASSSPLSVASERLSPDSSLAEVGSPSRSRIFCSPPEGLLFSGGRDCSIRVWVLEQQVCMHSLRLHESDVLALAADSEGQILVSGSADGVLLVWSTERLTALFRLQVPDGLNPWISASAPWRAASPGPNPRGNNSPHRQPVSFTATVLVSLRDLTEGSAEECEDFSSEGGIQLWAARGDGCLSVWELRPTHEDSTEAQDFLAEAQDPLEMFLEAAGSNDNDSVCLSRDETEGKDKDEEERLQDPSQSSLSIEAEKEMQRTLRLKGANPLSALPSVCFEGSALSHQRGFLQLLQQFVSFPSVSGSNLPRHIKGCFDAAAFAARLLERALGAEVSVVHPANTAPLAAREEAMVSPTIRNERASDLTRGPPNANPVVFARLGCNRDRPTVVFYSHYDVVPAEVPSSSAPLASSGATSNGASDFTCPRLDCFATQSGTAKRGWLSDPWVVQCRDGYFYGRGVSDNKGPLLCSLLAVKHFIRRFRARTRIRNRTDLDRNDSSKLPFNFVWISEGEEENGSRGLEAAVEEKASWLKGAEYLICTNSYWADDHTPCLVHGMRGVLDVELVVSGSRIESHSGLDGGTANEPMKDLVRLLGSLFGPSGEFNVPGFFEDVRTPDSSELSQLDEAAECLAGQRGYDSEVEETKRLLKKRWLEPSVSILCVKGLTPSAAESRVIPGGASATLSIRLVSDQFMRRLSLTHAQKPVAVFRLIKDFLHSHFESLRSPNVLRVSLVRGGSPWGAPLKNPRTRHLFNVASQAIRKVWGVEPLFVREGGSMPALPFLMEKMQPSARQPRNSPRAHPPAEVAVCQLPFGQASDNAHLSNERIGMRQVERGVAVLVEMLEGLTQNLTF